MTFTEGGDVQLNSGKVIKGGDTSNLSRTEMVELYDTPASMFEILGIKKDVKHIIDKIDRKLGNGHITGCPANVDAITEIVKENIGTVIKDKVLNTATIMKALVVIIGFLGGGGLLVYFVLKALKIKIGI